MKVLLSKIYGLIVSLRVFLYQKGILRKHRLKHPVISVGNLTVGGTGKTPLVGFLAQILKKAGYQPVILSRGYKRSNKNAVLLVSDVREVFCGPEECGDEPYLLARKLEGVPVVVGNSRYQAGRLLEDRYSNLIYLLDDGYQHIQLKRNLNILILDATDPFGGHHLLPAGRLREPTKAIARADAIVITRSHMFSETENLEEQIRRWNQRVPISYFHHDVTALYDARTGTRFQPRDFLGSSVIALAAIGSPHVFLHDLEHYQMKISDRFIFRDHHPFSQPELDRVLKRLEEVQARAVVTTEKDAVRLKKLDFQEGQIFVLQIEPQPEDLQEYKKEFLNEVKFLPEAQ
ncbi:MAG: tetraacyldisaccharide 4'-kinase [Acidobacteria bacterium]|nr:tetraacyldisaccharide 4'-kinase [Acidobacteriota bacterium]